MSFYAMYNRMMDLVQNTDKEVPEDIACRREIVAMRDCLKNNGDCGVYSWDLSVCQADLRVAMEERIRISMGIAKYNEYTKSVEDELGPEEADKVLNLSKRIQADTHAKKLLWNVGNGKHPKGAPKPDWTPADIARYEMGEAAYKEATSVLIAEFGLNRTDQLLGVVKEQAAIRRAIMTVSAGLHGPKMTDEDLKKSIRTQFPHLKLDGTDSEDDLRSAIAQS